jgi:hypothetical protein
LSSSDQLDGASAGFVRVRLSDLRAAIQNAAQAGANQAVRQFFNSLGSGAKRLLSNPRSFILTVVAGWIVANFIRPPIRAVVIVTARLGAAIESGFQAVAGIPLFVANAVGGGFGAFGGALLGVYADYTQAVEALAADAGILGFPIVTFLNVVGLAVGLAVGLWLTWYAIRAIVENIDIPYISLEGLFNLFVRPVRALAGALLGVFR